MGEMGDRIDRAERYVLGQMDEVERERAERDLEVDPAFRAAMVEIAERMHVFDRAPTADETSRDDWRSIKEKLEAMPQMRAADAQPEKPGGQGGETPDGPVAFGRRPGDKRRLVPNATLPVTRVGPHSVPGRKALILALCLIAAFALGYVAGVSSLETPSPASTSTP